MKDEDKTKEQLTNELGEMRQRIAELEASETKRKQAERKIVEYEELNKLKSDLKNYSRRAGP